MEATRFIKKIETCMVHFPYSYFCYIVMDSQQIDVCGQRLPPPSTLSGALKLSLKQYGDKSDYEAHVDLISVFLRRLWIDSYENWHTARFGKTVRYASSPRWDGGTDSMGRNHTNKWKELARYLVDNDMHYVAMVCALFEAAGTTPPVPTMIKSPYARKCYEKYQRDEPVDYVLSLESQRLAFLIAMRTANDLYPGDPNRALLAVACDENVPISAVMRYWLLDRIWPKQAREWLQAAANQYLANPQMYDTYWIEFLPESLLRYVNSIRPTSR